MYPLLIHIPHHLLFVLAQFKADTYEPDYRNSFWGAKNYARLAAIKKQVDPKNAFTVWNGVGFDDQSPRWRCYKQ